MFGPPSLLIRECGINKGLVLLMDIFASCIDIFPNYTHRLLLDTCISHTTCKNFPVTCTSNHFVDDVVRLPRPKCLGRGSLKGNSSVGSTCRPPRLDATCSSLYTSVGPYSRALTSRRGNTTACYGPSINIRVLLNPDLNVEHRTRYPTHCPRNPSNKSINDNGIELFYLVTKLVQKYTCSLYCLLRPLICLFTVQTETRPVGRWWGVQD